jgi:hypothetical protein
MCCICVHVESENPSDAIVKLLDSAITSVDANTALRRANILANRKQGR